jgi:C4-dicarboxylate-specific signal transduction histidine kinase
MSILLAILFFIMVIYLAAQIANVKKAAEAQAARAKAEQAKAKAEAEADELNARIRVLARFEKVADADAEAKRIIEAARQRQEAADTRLARVGEDAERTSPRPRPAPSPSRVTPTRSLRTCASTSA